MKSRLLLILILCIGVALIVAMNQAPQTSSIQLSDCADCLQFPTVTGETLNGETVTLPDYFSGDLNLVILPFDREQQEGVIDWLSVAQDLEAEFGISYYSVGALPDLNAGVRLLISGGMTLVLEPDVRDRSILLYLPEQDLFAQSIGADNLEQTEILILNNDGEILWQAQGNYSDALTTALRGKVAQLALQ